MSRSAAGQRRSHNVPQASRDLATAAAASVAFTVLAAAVARGDTRAIDSAVRRREPRARNRTSRGVALGVTTFGYPVVHLPLSLLISYAFDRSRVRGGPAVVAASAGSLAMDRLLKAFVRRHRPPGYDGNEVDESFPSGHTAAATAIALTAATVLRRQNRIPAAGAAAIAGGLPLAMGLSRLALDQHWAADVLGGWLLGGSIASLALAADAYTRRRARRQ